MAAWARTKGHKRTPTLSLRKNEVFKEPGHSEPVAFWGTLSGLLTQVLEFPRAPIKSGVPLKIQEGATARLESETESVKGILRSLSFPPIFLLPKTYQFVFKTRHSRVHAEVS